MEHLYPHKLIDKRGHSFDRQSFSPPSLGFALEPFSARRLPLVFRARAKLPKSWRDS